MAELAEQSGPEKKTFSLKPNESELINGELRRHNVALASIFSFIAIERLAYPVDAQTAFQPSADLRHLDIWQLEVEDVETEDVPAPELIDLAKPAKKGKE